MKIKVIILLLLCSVTLACNSDRRSEETADSAMVDSMDAAMDTTQMGTMDQMDGTDATNTGADTSGVDTSTLR